MNFLVKAIRKIGDLEFVKPYDDQFIDFNFWHLIRETKARSEFFSRFAFNSLSNCKRPHEMFVKISRTRFEDPKVLIIMIAK